MPDGFFTGMSAGQARAAWAQMRKIDRNIARSRAGRRTAKRSVAFVAEIGTVPADR